METTAVRFGLPTSRAFDGMKRVLFQPFDLGKWFLLGFTAWLAGLLDGGGSAGGGVNVGDNPREGRAAFREASVWVQEHLALVLVLAAVVCLVLLGFFLVALWLSSRGKFMLLDNVLHNRARVAEPWHQFRAQGNSLFWWRLAYAAVVLCLLLFLAGLVALAIALSEVFLPVVILGVILLLPCLLVVAYISTLLEDFVVPLMYRHALTTNEAWRRFLAVHRPAMGTFVGYALWKLLLVIGTTIGIMVLGFGTCCLGFVLMVIPFLGTVLLLPVPVFYRLLGPEFLRQFGTEWNVFPGEPARAVPPVLD